MRCRHKRTWTRHRLLLKSESHANAVTDKVCQRCGSWLGLGPSNDTDRALAELWAAELAATSEHNGMLPALAEPWSRGPEHSCDSRHRAAHGGDDCLRCDAIRLAFEIAEAP